MRPRGWNSNGTVSWAVVELKNSGLLIKTRMGMRPNRAAWFALGWQSLDESNGLDIDPRMYRTGQYKTLPLVKALTPIKGAMPPFFAWPTPILSEYLEVPSIKQNERVNVKVIPRLS